jgi:hypothetical protein
MDKSIIDLNNSLSSQLNNNKKSSIDDDKLQMFLKEFEKCKKYNL